MKGAIAKVLGALLDRLTKLVGDGETAKEILDKAKDWLSDKLKDIDPLGILLNVKGLKADVKSLLLPTPTPRTPELRKQPIWWAITHAPNAGSDGVPGRWPPPVYSTSIR